MMICKLLQPGFLPAAGTNVVFVDSFHGLKEPLFHSVLSWSSGGAQLQPWGAVEWVVEGMNGHLWIDENDWTERLHAPSSVTYEGLRKASLKEDAGRAHNVVQYVAVLHQCPKRAVEQVLLHVPILCCVHSPHFPIHYPLQRQTVLLPPLRCTLSERNRIFHTRLRRATL